MLDHARKLARTSAGIDYFATSLPTMLLFDDDLTARQRTTALFLERLGINSLDELPHISPLLDDGADGFDAEVIR